MSKKTMGISDLGEKIGGARKDRAVPTGPRRAKPAEADPRPAWARRFVAMEQIDRATKRGTGRWSLVDMGKNERYGGRALMRDLPSREAAEKAIPMAAVARNHRVRSTADNKFEIWRSVTDRKNVKVTPEVFDTREQAHEFMARNAVKIIETKTGFGEEILAKPEKVYRTGPAVRPGDVAGESFMKALGMRGVEFGNWQGERQTVLNHAFDALHDLAQVTGVDPHEVALKGDLAVAFGARGHGLSSARAHYEPRYAAMNLTKLEGAGALAHEWFHGLDHMMGRIDEPKFAEIDNKSSTKAFKEHLSDGVFASNRVQSAYRKGNLPDPVRTAYKDLIDSLYHKPEKYTEDAQRAQKFTAATAKELSERIASLRKGLTEKLPYGKRNVAPAKPAQLAKFDAAAARILAGEDKTKWQSFEKKPSPWNRGFGTGSRWTSDALEEISAVYKEVRGRSGFDSQHSHGPLDHIVGAMRTHEQRLAMLKDAESQSVKTKMVPTNYSMQARRLDEGRVGDYWQVRHEMAARAFSAYVEDKLAEANRRSDYLSFGSDNKYYQMLGQKPFPEGAERTAINAKFDALFQAMRDAKVMRAGVSIGPVKSAVMQPDVEKAMKAAPSNEVGAGIKLGWSDAAREKSAEVRKTTSEWSDAEKYRELPNGDRMVTKAFADAMRREAESLPASDPTRSLKIEHAGIIEGTAWRKDGSAYVPALHEAADTDLKKQQADAFAKTTRGKRGLQKAEKAKPEYAKPAKAKPAPRAAALGDNGAPSEKAIKTAAKLEAVAKATADKAEKIANQPRLMNTARRARMGGNVIDEANAQKAHAETALKIAAALRNGEAGNLAGVSSLTDVRALNSLYRNAMHEADRVLNRGYQQGRAPNPADIDYAKMPSAFIRTTSSDIADFKKVLPKGYARDIALIEKHSIASDLRYSYGTTDEKVIEAAKRVAKAVSEKGGRQEKWHANKILEEIRDYDRVKSLGIDSPEKLKAVLRDYVGVRQSKKGIDPVTLAERDLIGMKLPGFFPTPDSLAKRMAEMADIRPGMKVLEPSAGTGRIADAAKAAGAEVHVVEMQSRLRDILAKKGHNLVDSDFTSMPTESKYDRIVMNPPFEKGQDMAHVKRAYDMLKPGGKMVAVMGEGGFFRGDKTAAEFRSWLDAVGGESEKLPEGTFKESNTGVNTRLVTITKPGPVEAPKEHHVWDDKARAASAAARANNAPAPVLSAVERAMAKSQERAASVPQNTLALPPADPRADHIPGVGNPQESYWTYKTGPTPTVADLPKGAIAEGTTDAEFSKLSPGMRREIARQAAAKVDAAYDAHISAIKANTNPTPETVSRVADTRQALQEAQHQAKAPERQKIAAERNANLPNRAASRSEFMAQAEVRAHPEGGHEVKGPGTNGEWVRTSSSGTPTAAKLTVFSKIAKGVNRVGAIAMVAAPAAAALVAWDAAKSDASAAGLTPAEAMTNSAKAAAAAGGITAGVMYGIGKTMQAGFNLAAKAAPKIAPALGPLGVAVGLGFAGYGAYKGYKAHGLKGAVLGTVGADAILDRAPVAHPAPAKGADFSAANANFNAMKSVPNNPGLRGWANPKVQAAAQAAKGREFHGFKSP